MKTFVQLVELLYTKRPQGKRWSEYSTTPVDRTAQLCLQLGNRVILIQQKFPFSMNKRVISFRKLEGKELEDVILKDFSAIGQIQKRNESHKLKL